MQNKEWRPSRSTPVSRPDLRAASETRSGQPHQTDNMAGAGARGRSNSVSMSARGGRRGQARRAANVEDPLADVYKEMLSEAASSVATMSGDEDRPLKRRRIGKARPAVRTKPDLADKAHKEASPADHSGLFGDNELKNDYPPAHQQTITDCSEEESEESEMEWEEVGLQHTVTLNEGNDAQPTEADKVDLTIVMGGPQASKKSTPVRRRNAITSVEKRVRLDVHKIHVLCLLVHVHIRNAWCNDSKVQVRRQK